MRDEWAVALVILTLMAVASVAIILFTSTVVLALQRIYSWGHRTFSLPWVQWPIFMCFSSVAVGSFGSALVRSVCQCQKPVLSHFIYAPYSTEQLIDACNTPDYLFQRMALAGLRPIMFVLQTIPKIVGYDLFVPFCRHTVSIGNHLIHFVCTCFSHWWDRVATLVHIAQR